MGGVVEADAEDGARPRDGREQQRHRSSANSSPSAGVRSPEASRSRTVPEVKSTTRSPRTSPARGSSEPGTRKVARRIGRASYAAGRNTGVQNWPRSDDDVRVDVGAIKAAAAASAASYRSFADATRSVLDLLERLMPECALYLSHLDRAHAVHRIVDTRGGTALGLRSNLATPMADSYDLAMAEERAPRLCNDLSADPVYGALGAQRRSGAGSYLGVPLELSDGAARRRAGRARPRRGRVPGRRRAALHDARARARLRARARVQRARPAPAQRLAARPRARHGRGRPRGQRARRRRRRPPRRLPRRLRDGGRAGRLPARALGPRVRLHRDERRRDGAGDDPAAAGHDRARVHGARELLRDRRPLAPGARAAAGRRDRPRARRSSSRCCATARSPAC